MRLLFIGLNYHEYTIGIRDEFSRLGFETFFHDIQPPKLLFKISRRLNGDVYQGMLDRYHESIVDSYPAGYFDRVVFLQVHQFSHRLLAKLKERQPEARFTLYNWDAVTTHDYRPYMAMFDRVLTFDPHDASQLGIGYLPLFGSRRYQKLRDSNPGTKSVYFIGNIVNPDRYRVVHAFKDFCLKAGIEFRFYLSTTVHGWTQMVRSGVRPRNVHFLPIWDDRQDQMIGNSSAVFDFANHRQAGFTMRVMENLCADRKVITNNVGVESAPFFSRERFLVYDGLDFSRVPEFLDRPDGGSATDVSEYFIQGFAARLLGIEP